MPSLYIAVFLILSVAISWAPWPSRYRSAGLWLAVLALLLSILLSWQVQTVSGSWFALTQKFDFLARNQQTTLLVRLALGVLRPMVAVLAVGGHLGFPALQHGLGVALVFLFLFLLLKGAVLPLLYLQQRYYHGMERVGLRRRPQRRLLWIVNLFTLGLLLFLTLVPLALQQSPHVMPLVNQPVWMGLWILVLELRLWVSRRCSA